MGLMNYMTWLAPWRGNRLLVLIFFTKIFAEDVNFYNYRKVDYLEAACKTSDVNKPYPYAYPPRFVLEVSARYAKQYSTIELTFSGAKRDLYTEIQLHPLRCKLRIWCLIFFYRHDNYNP